MLWQGAVERSAARARPPHDATPAQRAARAAAHPHKVLVVAGHDRLAGRHCQAVHRRRRPVVLHSHLLLGRPAWRIGGVVAQPAVWAGGDERGSAAAAQDRQVRHAAQPRRVRLAERQRLAARHRARCCRRCRRGQACGPAAGHERACEQRGGSGSGGGGRRSERRPARPLGRVPRRSPVAGDRDSPCEHQRRPGALLREARAQAAAAGCWCLAAGTLCSCWALWARSDSVPERAEGSLGAPAEHQLNFWCPAVQHAAPDCEPQQRPGRICRPAPACGHLVQALEGRGGRPGRLSRF